ncbi:KTSC domain-containing protein [Mesorhizobium sp. C089B]|nr:MULTISPECIES: KTSC domain-containing protein [unclassified Mesorhizobium]WJI50143.1 KTSC domain-containing protein [Mesorhizobium sp. C089B]
MPSTAIRKFDYDPNTRVLSVWFVASGKHYEFWTYLLRRLPRSDLPLPRASILTATFRNRYAFRLAAGSSDDLQSSRTAAVYRKGARAVKVETPASGLPEAFRLLARHVDSAFPYWLLP